jgi:hypothetical protein
LVVMSLWVYGVVLLIIVVRVEGVALLILFIVPIRVVDVFDRVLLCPVSASSSGVDLNRDSL